MRKTLICFAACAAFSALTVASIEAVIDVYARGRVLSAQGMRQESARPSSALSVSLAHYTMGIIYDNEGKFGEAIREYRRALALEPNVSYVHTRLAVDYILTNKNKEALDELKTARSLDPADMKPKFLTALSLTSQGRFEDARKEYADIMRMDPESVWALSSLADLLVLQQKMKEAAAIYEKLLEKEKDSKALSTLTSRSSIPR